MTIEKQINNNQKLKQNQASEAELIKGKHGKALFSDWYKPPENDDCSRAEIAKSYRLRREY